MSRLIVVLLSLLCALATANRSDSSESKQKALSSPFPFTTLDESCFQDIQFGDKLYYHPVAKDSKGNIYFQGYRIYDNQNNSVIFGNFDARVNLYTFVIYYDTLNNEGKTRIYNFVQQSDGTFTNALTYGVNSTHTGYFDDPQTTTVKSCNSFTGSSSVGSGSNPSISSTLKAPFKGCFRDSAYSDKFYYHIVTSDSAGNIYFYGYGVFNDENNSIIFGNLDVQSNLYNFVLYYTDTGRSRVYNFVNDPDASIAAALTYGVEANQKGYFSEPTVTVVSPC